MSPSVRTANASSKPIGASAWRRSRKLCMALLEAAGRAVENIWTNVDDETPLPDGPALISFARLERDSDSLAARNAPLGVTVSSKTHAEDLAPYLDRVSLVAIQFPVSKDGRGFTIARALRERY